MKVPWVNESSSQVVELACHLDVHICAVLDAVESRELGLLDTDDNIVHVNYPSTARIDAGEDNLCSGCISQDVSGDELEDEPMFVNGRGEVDYDAWDAAQQEMSGTSEPVVNWELSGGEVLQSWPLCDARGLFLMPGAREAKGAIIHSL